jgi:hypothetical protein
MVVLHACPPSPASSLLQIAHITIKLHNLPELPLLLRLLEGSLLGGAACVGQRLWAAAPAPLRQLTTSA